MNQLRIGQGIDVHAFEKGRKLVLGGVEIPNEIGLAGHSDADVVLHALVDALLGATGQGDIGSRFPDSDVRWKGADSARFVLEVWGELSAIGWRIQNVDISILAQKPRISPFVLQMRERIAGQLNCSFEQVAVKATTTEKLGFVGREEGIAALAVVLLEKREKRGR